MQYYFACFNLEKGTVDLTLTSERCGLLSPHKNKKGNRQFTKADIDNFHLIYHLVKEKGMTLKGAQMKLRENKAETETNFEVVKRLKAIKEELLQIKDQLQ